MIVPVVEGSPPFRPPASPLVALARRWPHMMWLDGLGAPTGPGESGGPARDGWLGLQPDRVLEGDDPGLLDRVETLRRAAPQHPWLGWLTYDLGADLVRGRRARSLPLVGACFRRFASHARIESGRTVGVGPDAARDEAAARSIAGADAGAAWPFGALASRVGDDEYRARVAAAIERIRAGDTYQVNLSQPFFAPWTGAAPCTVATLAERAADAYVGLRARASATMGAFIGVGDGRWMLSNSPETLIEVGGPERRDVSSFPIKGTRPRGPTADADRAYAEALVASEKDRAEHVMIVDLVRNDLGRVCEAGSVRVPRRFEITSLPTVHHLVSEVRGRLRADVRSGALLRALWPGGSITGAPKRRTVEIIESLEHEPRGIYCGAILALHPGGAIASIPIRTAMVDRVGLHLRSGGGVVLDSEPEDERLETVAKARAFAAPV